MITASPEFRFMAAWNNLRRIFNEFPFLEHLFINYICNISDKNMLGEKNTGGYIVYTFLQYGVRKVGSWVQYLNAMCMLFGTGLTTVENNERPLMQTFSCFGGAVVSVPAIEHKVCGFKPGRGVDF
jgi:hypothetical protein